MGNPQAVADDRSRMITVCDSCWQASCWQGKFFCDDATTADTTQKSVHDLKRLGLEHPSYWKTDEELANE